MKRLCSGAIAKIDFLAVDDNALVVASVRVALVGIVDDDVVVHAVNVVVVAVAVTEVLQVLQVFQVVVGEGKEVAFHCLEDSERIAATAFLELLVFIFTVCETAEAEDLVAVDVLLDAAV